MNYDKLNEAAQELHDAAYRKAHFVVADATRSSVALDHGIDKLDTLVHLANFGEKLTSDEDRETLAAIMNRALGKVPLFGASDEVNKAGSALGARGFKPDFAKAGEHIAAAQTVLTEQKENVN